VKYVLDASAAIAALNDVGSVRARLADVPASEVGIPIVAVAELLFGACKSSRREENLARIADLKRAIAVLPLSDRVAGLYGETRAALEAKGLVKTDFDLVIACTALAQEATLVTSDRGLLDDSIPGLRAENWLE
jgi:predicted nucleic acid-binding protein